MQDTAGEVMYSYGSPHKAKQKQDDQLEHTYSSSMRIQDVALKTCQRRWTIGKSGERGSGISVPAARHDDDDETLPDGQTLRCPCVGVHEKKSPMSSSSFPSSVHCALFVLLGKFVRWEASCCTTAVLCGVASKICPKLYVAFLCSFHLASIQCV